MASSKPDFPKKVLQPMETRSNLRQGSVLPTEVCKRLNLVEDGADPTIMVTATHDCDCVKPRQEEPYIEVMRGAIIRVPNGNYTNAKNPRILHMELETESAPVTVEILASPKIVILKQKLEGVLPSAHYKMSDRQKRTFSIWLRSRYSRTALPDALGERLRVVKDAIEDAGKASPQAIHGIYIYYDPLTEVDPGEVYEVQISVVYDSLIEGAQLAAETAAKKIEARFLRKFKTEETVDRGVLWQQVYLSKCEAVPDTEFTFAEMLETQQYQLDHVSLRHDPQLPVADPM